MSQPTCFSSGLEYADHVASTSLLPRSLEAILALAAEINSNQLLSSSFSLGCKIQEDENLKVIAFGTSPICTQLHLVEPEAADLVSSSTLKESYNVPDFEFLCTKKFPSFSVNKTAVKLFSDHRGQLFQLKSQIDSSKPLIVTGHGLGGPIASLFTLWLLDSMGSSKNRPLCITFGSPLIGDKNLQQSISRSSTWNSCFLHVVSLKDPVPRSFISLHKSSVDGFNPQTNEYQPFGTFFLCSNNGSACFENPESILVLLVAMGSIGDPNQGLQAVDYKKVVENLNQRAICNDFKSQAENITHSNPLRASIILQLWGLGFPQMQQQNQNIDFNDLVTMIEEQTKLILQKTIFDPNKKFNEMKINMANLEWYKKLCKTKGEGYYDSYKNERYDYDLYAVNFVTPLKRYWEDMVEEAEMKPQKEGAAFRTRWLFAGTNYRRMVEPLHIAEYYRERGTDYMTGGRSKHYKQLEEWLRKDQSPSNSSNNNAKKQNVELLLTMDSCFWAHVEEALLCCKLMRNTASGVSQKEMAKQKLMGFENYVYGLLKNYAVSPEIFLKDSSYMRWWNVEYKAIEGTQHNLSLVDFMSNSENYHKYATGDFDFP